MLQVDVNEPISDILPLLGQTGIPLEPTALNVQGYADYRWTKWDGTYKQVERKQWGEILANPDHIEEKLLRHLTKNPDHELVLLIEGMVQQTEVGTVIIKPSRQGIFVKDHTYSTRMKRVYSLLYAASKYVEIMYTTTIRETATCLVAMYEYDQKETHETFNRHIKQASFVPDVRVTTLMGMSNGLGDKRATALIREFGTPWNIVSAGWRGDPVVPSIEGLTIVPGIGKGIVENLLRGIGRPDV